MSQSELGQLEAAKALRLVIETPVGDWKHPFRPAETVAEIIKATIDHFRPRLQDGTYELRRKRTNEVLAPEKTLEAYGIEEGEHLVLVPDDGGGR